MAIAVVPAAPKHLRQRYRFAVLINGFDSMYFTTMDRPNVSFDVVEFNPAGSHRPEKLPGRVSFGALTLEKGVSAVGTDQAAYDWMKKQLDFLTGKGGNPTTILKDITIEEGDRSGKVVADYTLRGAFISEFDGGDLDGSDSENVMESITFEYQFLEY